MSKYDQIQLKTIKFYQIYLLKIDQKSPRMTKCSKMTNAGNCPKIMNCLKHKSIQNYPRIT